MARGPIVSPVKRRCLGIDDPERSAPRIRTGALRGFPAKVRREKDRSGIGVQQNFLRVEPRTVRRIEGTFDSISIILAVRHLFLGDAAMPDAPGLMAQII